VQPVHAGRTRQRRVHRSGLDERATILGINGDDAAQPVEPDDHRVVLGERPAREPGTRAARHEGDALLGERAHDGDQLVARLGENRKRWSFAIEGQAVGAVSDELARAREHGTRPNDRC
jgi:hypothetical protein